jgi:mono/diheme cytochrome c family protein
VRRDWRAIAAAALIGSVAGTGCTRIEYTIDSVPFLAYMRDAPSFDPYEAPRPAPAGAVPFMSPAGDVPMSIVASDPGLRAFGESAAGVNPFTADSAFIALGQVMYERHCSVCHGPQGMGGTTGSIIQTDAADPRYPPLAPNLTLPITVERSDGYLYGMIAVARGSIMPPYGGRTNHRDRWAIVSYVRQLQQRAGQTGGGN